MSNVRWEVDASSRRGNGKRAVTEWRVRAWHSDGQQLRRPQTSSAACDGGRDPVSVPDEFGEIRWRLAVETAVDQHAGDFRFDLFFLFLVLVLRLFFSFSFDHTQT